MKLLIIEDEPELREIIQQSLEREKFLIETAADFLTAMDKVGAYDYDCILLDIMLPGGSGLEILGELKKMPLRLEQEFDVGARIARFGRTSMTFAYEILSLEGQVISTGEQVWVNTDAETHKPKAWDPKFVALVKAREGDRLVVDIPA